MCTRKTLCRGDRYDNSSPIYVLAIGQFSKSASGAARLVPDFSSPYVIDGIGQSWYECRFTMSDTGTFVGNLTSISNWRHYVNESLSSKPFLTPA